MGSIGDDQKIRALYSELKFADEQTAPRFAAVWQRAQSRSLKPRRAFNLSFAAVTALLIFALASLAIWSKYSQPSAPAMAFGTVSAVSDFPTVQINKGAEVATPIVLVKEIRPSIKSRPNKLGTQRQSLLIASSRVAKEAKALESWQSPTASLLTSSSDDIFKSLPQLNENASELKSFLPNRENDKEK
jgi:hypothetical protein